MRDTIFTLAAVALLAAPSAGATTPPGSPMAQLKQQNERIDRVLKRKAAVGSPEEKAAKEELKGIVSELLDYRELAVRSLGVHWEKLSKAQQEEFVRTLRELIERNYVKQLRTNLDYQVVYKKETVADGDATVSTVVKARTRGKSTDLAVDYKLRRVDARWMVYDVINDEQSMVQNYRAQFNRIITNEGGYDALLQRMQKMKKKLDEAG